ncbi:AAA family ATPase [Kutzneria kofuensis]|uniref:ATPase AAA-type core domain-containing protein n=1 Tax=Kutzneria kofuensis TaxID=103725 RepID=A0A7W9KL41_9PSEU|nr:ATP-binding protein [Kutzneria kofuensis]MBB5894258.1 hypothetical protein [Kutzneria kofuensis]
MLRSFRVANHRSIRDEQELLLLPAYQDNEPAVPVAAVYGANASGKSNLVDALAFMAMAVRHSFGRWSPDGGVPRRPFKLDPEAGADPSAFVVDVLLDGVPHTYGFLVDDSRVLSEWLYSYPEKRRRVMFEREGDKVKIGSTVQLAANKLEGLVGLMRPNALFLGLAVQSNVVQLYPVYRFFDDVLAFRPFGFRNDTRRLGDFLNLSPHNLERVTDLVRVADVGVRGMHVIEPSELDANDRLPRIAFTHAGSEAVLDFIEESEGTRSWVVLLPVVLTALDRGQTLVLDELDTSLHPKLTAQLVRLFQEPGTNPNHAQLIFTTHDTSLLGTMLGDEVLKRDQVWFVEKDGEGASKLYPLTDFHPRKGENTERRYLGGSYGAVPVLSERDFAEAVRTRNAS